MIAGKRAAAEMMMIEQNGQQLENDEGDGNLQWLHQAVIEEGKQPGKAHCAEETGDDERLCSDGKKTTALGEEEEGSNW